MKALFVCTGNTCRSPMAEGIFKNEFPEHSAASAGTMAFGGEPASHNAVAVMKERGIDLSVHRSRPLNEKLIADADIVLVMTGQHKTAVTKLYPDYADKVFTLKDYATNVQGDIDDPFGRDEAAYEECAQQLHTLISLLYSRMTVQ